MFLGNFKYLGAFTNQPVEKVIDYHLPAELTDKAILAEITVPPLQREQRGLSL